MITAKFDMNNVLVSPVEPRVGEMIYVEGMGQALVEVRAPYCIKLQYQESPIGQFSSEYPFEVRS